MGIFDWLSPDEDNATSASDTEIVTQVCLRLMRGAAVGVSLAPIPGIAIVPQVVDGLILMVQNAQANSEEMKTVSARCTDLQKIVNRAIEAKGSDDVSQASQELSVTLCRVYTRMETLSKYGRFRSFILQSQVRGGITQCSTQLNSQIEKFSLACNVDTNIKVNCAINLLEEMQERGQNNLQQIHDVMANVQGQLRTLNSDSKEHKRLAQELYNVQKKNNKLLPDFELKAGEVKRIGTQPIDGTNQFDIWEGLYLENEKCTLKVIRAAQFNEKERDRLLRSMEIWRKLYDVDEGVYVVKFYGVCFIDGPYPYIVNPYYRNGDALTYIRQNPRANRLAIIRRVAKGLRLMHNQVPPIVHGELKASKIMINDDGYALLADFGLSKMIENATSVSFTQTVTFSSQYPWFAPEVCSETFTLSAASDVYSFGMTILELLTGLPPFHTVKRPTEILLKVRNGERPQRPTEPEVAARGLDDNMWNLLQRCWKHQPEDRPTIEEVLRELPEVQGI